jgi:hypothetical protein
LTVGAVARAFAPALLRWEDAETLGSEKEDHVVATIGGSQFSPEPEHPAFGFYGTASRVPVLGVQLAFATGVLTVPPEDSKVYRDPPRLFGVQLAFVVEAFRGGDGIKHGSETYVREPA